VSADGIGFLASFRRKIIGTIGGINCHHCSETQKATRAPYDPYAFGSEPSLSPNGRQRRRGIAEP
jgi:hypothetical protein